MKKLAILFGLMVLTSQFPLNPSRAFSGNLMSSLEFGRQWSTIFLRAFGPVDAAVAPAHAPAEKPAVAGESCPYAGMADMDVPEPDVELVSFAEVPAAPADIVLPADAVNLKPVIVSVKGPFNQAEISVEVQKEMTKALQELRVKMKELDAAHRQLELQREIQTRTGKATRRLEKVRIIVNTKSA